MTVAIKDNIDLMGVYDVGIAPLRWPHRAIQRAE